MKLELKDISVNLSDKKILKSINLKVKDGEFISLLGASGCGKSTMLKTITGIIKQDKGSIILDGNVADKIPVHKRKIVMVFQDFRLFPHMTVLENIEFPLKMLGISKDERKKKATGLLEKVKLSGFENRHVNEISGGQIQRIALARALAAEPGMILLDEPFSSLDINLRKDIRELVLELQKKSKITTILVTHDTEEALTMSNRIAFMHKGKIVQYDTPEEIFKNPVNTIVADYFSDGVYLYGEILNNKFVSGVFTFNINKDSGRYKCLIRPAAVKTFKDKEGLFRVINKVYKGDSYLLKLHETYNHVNFESIVSDTEEIEKGDIVNIELKKDKLIFISER